MNKFIFATIFGVSLSLNASASTISDCEFDAEVTALDRAATLNGVVVANSFANSYQYIITLKLKKALSGSPEVAACAPYENTEEHLILKGVDVNKYAVGTSVKLEYSYRATLGSSGVEEYESWIVK